MRYDMLMQKVADAMNAQSDELVSLRGRVAALEATPNSEAQGPEAPPSGPGAREIELSAAVRDREAKIAKLEAERDSYRSTAERLRELRSPTGVRAGATYQGMSVVDMNGGRMKLQMDTEPWQYIEEWIPWALSLKRGHNARVRIRVELLDG